METPDVLSRQDGSNELTGIFQVSEEQFTQWSSIHLMLLLERMPKMGFRWAFWQPPLWLLPPPSDPYTWLVITQSNGWSLRLQVVFHGNSLCRYCGLCVR